MHILSFIVQNQSRSVPMCWFLFRRAAACIGQTRTGTRARNRHECMTSHQLSVHLYWEDWEKQTKNQNELYRQSVSSPASVRSIIDIVTAQNRPTWLRKEIDFKKTRSIIDSSPRVKISADFWTKKKEKQLDFGSRNEVDPERTAEPWRQRHSL